MNNHINGCTRCMFLILLLLLLLSFCFCFVQLVEFFFRLSLALFFLSRLSFFSFVFVIFFYH